MTISICIHEDLEKFITKEWIIEHRNDEGEVFEINGFKVVIERNDMYDVHCTYINDEGQHQEGIFFVLDVIEY